MKRMACAIALATGAGIALGIPAPPANAAPTTASAGNLRIDILRPSLNAASSAINLDVRFRGATLHTIELYIDGTLVKRQTLSGVNMHGTIRFALDGGVLAAGEHELKIVATDVDGGEAAASTRVVVAGAEPTGPVTLQSPRGGVHVQGTVPLEARLDGSLKKPYVMFFVDNDFLALVNYPPYTYNWDSSRASNGRHKVSIEAYDGESLAKVKAPDTEVVVNNPGGFTERKSEIPDLGTVDRKPTAPKPPIAHTQQPSKLEGPRLGLPVSPVTGAEPRTNVEPLNGAHPTGIGVTRSAYPSMTYRPRAHGIAGSVLATVQPEQLAGGMEVTVDGPQPIHNGMRFALPTGIPVPTAPTRPRWLTPGFALSPTPLNVEGSDSLMRTYRPLGPGQGPKPASADLPQGYHALGTIPASPDLSRGYHALGTTLASPDPSRGYRSVRPVTPSSSFAPAPATAAALLALPKQIAASLAAPEASIARSDARLTRVGNMAAVPAERPGATPRLARRSGTTSTIATTTTKPTVIKLTRAARFGSKKPFEVAYDNDRIDFDVQPKVDNGMPLLPFRQIFERSGGRIQWFGKSQTVRAVNSTREIELQIGAKQATVNNQPVTLEKPAYLDRGRTIVPLSFIQDAMDVDIHFDAATGRLLIEKKR